MMFLSFLKGIWELPATSSIAGVGVAFGTAYWIFKGGVGDFLRSDSGFSEGSASKLPNTSTKKDMVFSTLVRPSVFLWSFFNGVAIVAINASDLGSNDVSLGWLLALPLLAVAVMKTLLFVGVRARRMIADDELREFASNVFIPLGALGLAFHAYILYKKVNNQTISLSQPGILLACEIVKAVWVYYFCRWSARARALGYTSLAEAIFGVSCALSFVTLVRLLVWFNSVNTEEFVNHYWKPTGGWNT